MCLHKSTAITPCSFWQLNTPWRPTLKKPLISLQNIQKKDWAPEYNQIIWVSAGKVAKNFEENYSGYILFLQFPLNNLKMLSQLSGTRIALRAVLLGSGYFRFHNGKPVLYNFSPYELARMVYEAPGVAVYREALSALLLDGWKCSLPRVTVFDCFSVYWTRCALQTKFHSNHVNPTVIVALSQHLTFPTDGICSHSILKIRWQCKRKKYFNHLHCVPQKAFFPVGTVSSGPVSGPQLHPSHFTCRQQVAVLGSPLYGLLGRNSASVSADMQRAGSRAISQLDINS